MKRGFIVDYETVAALLAIDDDESQAAFFRVFFMELQKVCKTAYHREMQLAMISNKLDSEVKEHIRFLGYEEGK